MIGLLLSNWRLIAIGLVVMAVGSYVLHAEYVKKQWAEAQAIAKRQEAENAKQALRDLRNKERSDENYQRNIARLRADVGRLRDSRPVILPSTGSSPGGLDQACYDRDSLESAIRTFENGVLGLIEKGDEAIIGLDEAKTWIKNNR